MRQPTPHIIERQVLHISAGNMETARHWEGQAGYLMHQVIQPVLERCFDRLVPADQHLVIQRLELDLGIFHPNRFQQELEHRLESAIREALQQQMNQTPSKPEPGPVASRQEPNVIRTDFYQEPFYPADPEGLQPESAALFEAFLYFLVNGRLPWWKPAATLTFEDHWPASLTATQREQLKKVLAFYPAARTRLSVQFSPGFIAQLLVETGGAPSWLETWQWISTYAAVYPRELPALQQYFWSACAAELVENNHSSTPIGILRRISASAPASIVNIWWTLSHQVELEPDRFASGTPEYLKKALQTWQAQLSGNLEMNAAGQSPAKVSASGPTGTDAAATAYTDKNGTERTSVTKDSAPADNVQNPAPDAVFVNDAGLVLLHPFLPALFESCSLLKDRQFVSPEAQTRAVRLLGWLIWSSEDVPEYQLLLPKLLCGMDWETPLMATSPLTEQELQAAGQLLEAVIEHWQAIGQTSPDGLREGFLRRMGKLTPRGKDWRLEVEQKTVDILLNRLPWGYSMVRLPWMPGLLQVSWR